MRLHDYLRLARSPELGRGTRLRQRRYPRRQSGRRREVLGVDGGPEEPWVHCMRGGKIRIVSNKECLDGFAGCAELAEAVAWWLEETGW